MTDYHDAGLVPVILAGLAAIAFVVIFPFAYLAARRIVR